MAYKPYIKKEDGSIAEIELVVDIASRLGTQTKGTAKKPIYLVNGVPTECNNMVDLIYPVGSIYLSVGSTSPETLFGGTWQKLENMFLLGASSNYSVGSTGGEASHTLTTAELPSHKHDNTISVSASQDEHSHGLQSSSNYSTNCNGLARDGSAWSGGMYQVGGVANNNGDEYYVYQAGNGKRYVTLETPAISVNSSISNANAGGGSAHNNMPPYLAVNMWKRTA